eukprot:1474729-Amphidinium_carterae.1
MEENRKDHQYHPTTTTTGRERTEDKEKETSGTRKDRPTTWINLHQCGHYRMTTQHRIYNLLLRQLQRRS